MPLAKPIDDSPQENANVSPDQEGDDSETVGGPISVSVNKAKGTAENTSANNSVVKI